MVVSRAAFVVALVLASALVGVSAGGTPVTASASSAHPEIATQGNAATAGDFASGGWLALSVATKNSGLSMRFSLSASGARFTSFSIYNAEGRFLDQLAVYSAENEDGVYTNQTLVPGANASFSLTPPSSVSDSPGYVNFTGPAQAMTFKLLFWLAGEIQYWNYTIAAGPGTTILGFDSGPEAYLYQAKDFEGQANLRAYPAGVGARVEYETSRALQVHNTLVGHFGTVLASHDVVGMSTPSGERACTCNFNDATGPSALGPGEYVLHLTGVGAGPSGFADVLFTAADARLP